MYRITDVYDAVLERVKLAQAERKFDLHEGIVGLSDDVIRTTDGNIWPTVIMATGETNELYGGQGITSVRDDAETLSFIFLLLAGSARDLLQLHDVLRDYLLGYEPPGCGELYSDAGSDRMPVTSNLGPTRFARTIGFSLSVGAVVVP